jgi:lysyl-tRNA synthetase class 2
LSKISPENLKLRASVLKKIRSFLEERGIMEVETPLLGTTSSVDLHMEPFGLKTGGKEFYLETSPEFAMKRLLSMGSGSIYQITRAFRSQEQGRLHNPEFTMVEWYRVGFDHHKLMDEVGELVESVLNCGPVKKITYTEVMKEAAGFNPLEMSAPAIRMVIDGLGLNSPPALDLTDTDECLDFIFTVRVQPYLKEQGPVFVYDYPPSQAALAKLDPESGVAHRFELFVKGIELCNGYYELTDAEEQLQRFRDINRKRLSRKKPELPVDQHFIKALDKGLPECSGVALGFDRLVMLAAGEDGLSGIMPFTFDEV